MSRLPNRLRAAVLGATGIAGQQFLTTLADHPTFEVVALGASWRSAGKTYRDAIRNESGAVQWFADKPLPAGLADLVVQEAGAIDPDGLDIVFSALESDAAKRFESQFAEHLPVLSTASAFRYEPDVPILVPGVNPEHIALLDRQRERRGWRGFVAPNPNCTVLGLAITLAPLQRAFGIDAVLMTSLQAVSGAGRSPGVIGLDIIDNVIPHIAKEEEKVEAEARKILGVPAGETIEPAAFRVSATCTRVPVLEAHTETVYVSLSRPAELDEVRQAMIEFGQDFIAQGHPSAPSRLITVHDDPFRPQPRLDRVLDDGMTTAVGRLRPDPVLPNGIKYVLVSHNTKMGAAKGCVLMAEELVQRGVIKAGEPAAVAQSAN